MNNTISEIPELYNYFSEMIKTVSKAEKRLYYRDQTPESLTALVQLVHNYQPTKIIELGTLSGMSLRAWIQAGGEIEIISIDLSFKYLLNSQQILPIDLSRVKLIEQNIMTVDFSNLWNKSDRVLLYIDAHDLPNVPIMAHVLNNVVPLLPEKSTVAIDDLWYSRHLLSDSNAINFFEQVIIPQFDPIIFRELFYAPYWKGGSFAGFQEVIPLMEWVCKNCIDLTIQQKNKMVYFQLLQDKKERQFSSHLFDPQKFQNRLGRIAQNPVDCFASVRPDTEEKMHALNLCQQGIHFFAEDNYAQSFKRFQSAQQICPDMKGLSYALAVCFARVGQFENAIKALQAELRLKNPYEKTNQLLIDLQNWPDIAHSIQHTNNQKNQSITLFSTFKPFHGHANIIQRNAIISWTKLKPRPEIIVFGKEYGIAKIAQEFNLIHIPEIKSNKKGLPYINDMFYRAQSIASNDVLMYVNGDIIFTNDLIPSIDLVKQKFDSFLMVGRRWNVKIDQLIHFNEHDWDIKLSKQVKQSGKLYDPTGIDFLVFTRHLWPQIPPFVVGRAGWDNGMIYEALKHNVEIIDATPSVMAIHQNHDYGHLEDGENELRKGDEAQHNFDLFGGIKNTKNILDSNWILSQQNIIKKKLILQISTYPDHYLEKLQSNNHLQNSFDNQIQSIMGKGALEHLNFTHLKNFSYITKIIIENNKPSQFKWLNENNCSIKNEKEWRKEIIRIQIETLKPDILLFCNTFLFDSSFIKELYFHPDLIMAYIVDHHPPPMDLSEFDLVLSNCYHILSKAAQQGSKNVEFYNPGVPIWLLHILEENNLLYDDVCIYDDWSKLSNDQRYLIQSLAKEIMLHKQIKLGLYLTDHIEKLPYEIRTFHRGDGFGISRLQPLMKAKISISFGLNSECGTIVFFETTGVGTFLLTQTHKDNLLFYKIGTEIETFETEKDLVHKILYYLNHENQRKKIAQKGQLRCLKDHSMAKNIKGLAQIIHKYDSLSQKRVNNLDSISKLKCLVLCSYYPNYISKFYKIHEGLSSKPYNNQLECLINDCFGDSDYYSNGLKACGWDAKDVITNCAFIQEQWKRENNSAAKDFFHVLIDQIKTYKPDVVYIHDLSIWGRKEFLAAVRPLTKLIVGQIAYPLSNETHLNGFDIIFSSFPHYVDHFQKKGVTSFYIPLAFDPRVLDKIGHDIHRKYPVTFIGGISTNHQKGIDILEQICQKTQIDLWGYGIDKINENLCIKKCHHGEAWGLEMFKLMAQSTITINRHIDVAENFANNMRLYEATGCGALLLTDYKDNLNDLFKIGKEVIAYRSPEECVDLISYYLNHPNEAQKIAKAGQKRTLKDHSYINRMNQISEILKKHLK